MGRLQDQVILITGAHSIGAHLGQRFAQEGAKLVIFLDCDEQAIDAAANMIVQEGGQARGYCLDLTHADTAASIIRKIYNETGVIHAFVNHAGGAYPVAGMENVHTLSELDPKAWDASILLNLSAPFYCVNAVLPFMEKQGGGVFLHIGSVNGRQALGYPAYSSAKSGLQSLNRCIAAEKGRYKIRSNLLSPGTIKTVAWDQRLKKEPELLENLKSYYPLGHIIDYDDVSNAAVFLLSDEARSITGTELILDAGLLAGYTDEIEEMTQTTL